MNKQPTVRFLLRIPRELHEKLTEAANDKTPPSSLNGEIVRRLYESVLIESDEETFIKISEENEKLFWKVSWFVEDRRHMLRQIARKMRAEKQKGGNE